MSALSPRDLVNSLAQTNAEFAKSFPGDKVPKMEQMQAIQGNRFIVMTCLDPRCVPEQFFGPGFRGAVFRNAGGRATDDAIRSLNILRELIGMNIVVVVHHTDCGLTHVTEEGIRQYSKSKNPEAAAKIDKMEFGLWSKDQLEESIKEDVRKLRAEKTLTGMEVFGFSLETFTGVVTEVNV